MAAAAATATATATTADPPSPLLLPVTEPGPHRMETNMGGSNNNKQSFEMDLTPDEDLSPTMGFNRSTSAALDFAICDLVSLDSIPDIDQGIL